MHTTCDYNGKEIVVDNTNSFEEHKCHYNQVSKKCYCMCWTR